jgi:uncharacterized repeat protein (TIGR01451 family)
MAVPLVQAGTSQTPKNELAQEVLESTQPEAQVQASTMKEVLDESEPPTVSKEEALQKLHPDLREMVRTASPSLPQGVGPMAEGEPESISIEVFAEEGTDLSEYFVDDQSFARPPFGKGERKVQVFIGFTYPANLIKIAEMAQVQAVIPIVLGQNAEPMPYPADEPRELPEKGPEDWAELRANADELREGSLPWSEAKAFGDGRTMVQPMDWFEVMPEGPHKARTAWERGYRGEGVTVAVVDDGIDSAHPDLMGTQKIYSSTVSPQYNGWPMVFSPFSMLLYAYDVILGYTHVADGYDGIHYVDTSETPSLTSCGANISCFDYTPLIAYQERGSEHTYIVSDKMSKSGTVHVGTHPDNDLRDFLWGEKVAVLVTDPNIAGLYDTVYVDLDADYDFRDEKPLTKADVNDPSTYNDMIAYRDMNGDGLADISGGMLYFIADGVTPIPVSDWMYDGLTPGDGNLVAFSGGTFDRDYSHGTACASNVVGQGVTQSVDNGMLPEFRDLPGDGKPSAAVYGMAPGAKMVNVSDIYYNFASSKIDAYIFAAVGYDGVDQTGWHMESGPGYTDTDAIQITSNSYGSSDQDNDGWEYDGQVVSQVQRWYAPNLQFLFSTGNGASAYGTTAPPSPATGIGVGASTEFGSTGWDSITDTNQIMFNDVTPFSNRGPGARGTTGVDVVAGGAFAAGAEELNYYSISTWGAPDGNLSWNSWGGTSRSAPVAMGVLALIYQAYKDANGVWPTYAEAEALLKSSATDLNYDSFTQGAGSVNADRGTAVAGGHYGMLAEPHEWNPGDYRGNDWPGFAHIAYPGDTFTQTFTIRNTGSETVTAGIESVKRERIGSEEFTFEVTPDMVAAESAYGAENQDNFYKAFNYFIPITATVGVSDTMYGIDVPADTELMVVRQMFPFDQFDADGDYSWDNRFYLMVYNWKDVNSDGNVWEDKDGNDVVNFINSGGALETIDGGDELDWDDPRTELDRWEFGRFSYHRPGGNRNEMWVHDPLERMHDGLFIGLRHHPGSTYAMTTTLKYRVDFYDRVPASWLETGDLAGTVVLPNQLPPGAEANFVATTTVPSDIEPGIYEASIQISDSGMAPTYTENTTVIPVALNVASVFTDGMQLGGYDAYDPDAPYPNAAVRGLFDWLWRAESGDWRFYYTDVPDGQYPDGTKVLVKDEWDDPAPHTDIDTIVLGPTPTSLGTRWYDLPEPNFYGPYVLGTVGKSPNANVGGGTWQFNTSTGSNEDWVIAPIQDGLHAFLQHNVLFEGDKFDVVFTKTLGTLQEDPHTFALDAYVDEGKVGEATLTSTLPLNGLVADAYGLGSPEYITDEPIDFVNSNTIEWTHQFTVEHGAKIDLSTSSPDISDIDLYLFYCGPTGAGPCEQRGSSTTGTADEHIQVLKPEDGVWEVGINNWSGPAGHFDLTKVVVQGYDLTISDLPTGGIAAGTPATFTVSYSREMVPGETYEGLILVGPPEAPALKEIPVSIYKVPPVEKKVDKALAFPEDELHYTLSLENVSDPEVVRLVDPIPEYTEFVDASNNVTYDSENNRIVFHNTLTGTESITMTVRITDTLPSGAAITNTATMTATTLFEGEQSASAVTHIGAENLVNSYKEATAEVPSGGTIDYTIHISNTGEKIAHVYFEDPIPVSTTYESHVMKAGFVYSDTADAMVWDGSVAPGDEKVFEFSVQVDDSLSLWGTSITNKATVKTWDGTLLIPSPSAVLTDATNIVAPFQIYLPLITRNY